MYLEEDATGYIVDSSSSFSILGDLGKDNQIAIWLICNQGRSEKVVLPGQR